MTGHQALGRGGSASDHMLIAAADVRGDHFQDGAMFALSIAQSEFREIDRLYVY
jgi:hypothetical protein